MGGIIDGIKWGIILNLGAVVLLPLATRFLGTQPGSGGTPGRPFGYGGDEGYGYGFYCSDSTGYCGGGGEGGGMGGGGHGKKKHKGHGGGGYYW